MNQLPNRKGILKGKLWRSLLIGSGILLLFLSCMSEGKKGEGPGDRPAFRLLQNYPPSLSLPLEKRILPPPPETLQYLKELDGDESYRFHTLNGEEQKMLREALKNLPTGMRAILEKRLVGIYFVDGFLTSGMTDWILDQNGLLYPWIVIKTSVLHESAQELLERRENTAFYSDESRYELRMEFSRPLNGLTYILLHEGTHGVDLVKKITPYLEKDIADYQRRENPGDPYQFAKGVWEDYRTPVDSADFYEREMVTFYGFRSGPLLGRSRMPQLYEGLSGSPFVSLYGAASWAEDLAELFTFYHIQERMGIGYVLTLKDLSRGGKEVLRFTPDFTRRDTGPGKRIGSLDLFYQSTAD